MPEATIIPWTRRSRPGIRNIKAEQHDNASARVFRVGQVWRPRKPARAALAPCDLWTIVAISHHPACPVIAQAACGSVREFDRRGFFGGAEESEPSDLDLVTLVRDAAR
jgi:hypothetical protein